MIKLKKVKPMFDTIITTMNKYESDGMTANGLIDTNKKKGTIKEYQTVIAIGNMVRDVKEGDVVFINPSRYAVRKYEENSIKNDIHKMNPVLQYNFNIIELNDEHCLMLKPNDIEFIIEESEEIEEPRGPKVLVQEPKIIIP